MLVRQSASGVHASRQAHLNTNEKGSTTLNTITVPTRRVNKVAFVLLCFFLGGFGVDRFMRGQVGLGIFKLLIGSWATLGIWPLVDFIIALVKLGKYQDEFVFDNAGNWVDTAAL
jgi:TM2 domain-containing membrane protein YozV